ncbi:MAG: chromosome segregation protein SMC, partial [Bacteroidetes bacterium]|nr:chromosome segregation protein SMC [Bacteroidota bacterium]
MSEFSQEDKPRNTEPTQKERKGNKTALIIIIAILSIVLIAVGYYFIKENQQLELERDDKVAELVVAYDQLDSIGVELDQRIEEILRLGGDVEDLLVVQEELKAEKEQILKTKNVQIQDLRDRVAGYTFLLKEKDKQIVKLRALNQELLSENTE